jgi:hypothetical protein
MQILDEARMAMSQAGSFRGCMIALWLTSDDGVWKREIGGTEDSEDCVLF